jgi:hypothetical protein
METVVNKDLIDGIRTPLFQRLILKVVQQFLKAFFRNDIPSQKFAQGGLT